MATDAARYDRAILARDQARLVAGLPWWRIVWLAFWKRRVEKAVVIGSILYIMAIAIAVLWDGWFSLHLPNPIANLARQTRWSPNSVVYLLEGRDRQGRRAAFDLVVLKKGFHWAHGSSKDLVRDGEQLEEDKAFAAAFDFDVRINLAKSRELIGVGAASQEGDPQRELDRAGQRARQTAEWLKMLAAPETPIWTLNLGQYSEPCETCESGGTSWQRPFIVVGVREAEPNVDIGEALASAMSGKSNLPSPARYSAYEFRRYH